MSEDRIAVGRAEYLGGHHPSHENPGLRPNPPSGGSAAQKPPLSRAELAAVRATAMNLAIQLLGPMTSHEQANEAAFEFLHKVADRMLKYTMDGK